MINSDLCVVRECENNDGLGTCIINKGLPFRTIDEIEGTILEKSVYAECEDFSNKINVYVYINVGNNNEISTEVKEVNLENQDIIIQKALKQLKDYGIDVKKITEKNNTKFQYECIPV